MGCYVHVEGGEAEVWVSGQTSERAVQAYVAIYQGLGCRVIIYRSGKGDLAELTGDLLRYNKDSER